MSANLPKLVGSKEFLKVLREGSKALRELKKIDPRDRYVILFPDSDSAHVGLGFNCLTNPEAEEVFEKANRILGRDLLKLCITGPKDELSATLENRSLAVYVSSHARITKLVSERPNIKPLCKAAAGIGVGFINTLVFSESISFEDGLDLVQRRAKAMDRAASIIPTARLVIHVRPATSKRKLCQAAREHCLKQDIPQDLAICSVTRQIRPHLLEIAGHEEAIKYLEKEGYELFELRSMKRLTNTPDAYHTDLMKPASDFLSMYVEQKLKKHPDYLIEPSSCSVYSATSGCRLRSIKSILNDLYMGPKSTLNVEQLLQCLYMRPKSLSQPNTLVIGDKFLLKNILSINRKAWDSAKLLRA